MNEIMEIILKLNNLFVIRHTKGTITSENEKNFGVIFHTCINQLALIQMTSMLLQAPSDILPTTTCLFYRILFPFHFPIIYVQFVIIFSNLGPYIIHMHAFAIRMLFGWFQTSISRFNVDLILKILWNYENTIYSDILFRDKKMLFFSPHYFQSTNLITLS